MQKDAENHSCHKTDIFTNHAAYSYALMFNFPQYFYPGYFVYDFFDYAIGGRIMSNYEVILHHIAVSTIICFCGSFYLHCGSFSPGLPCKHNTFDVGDYLGNL